MRLMLAVGVVVALLAGVHVAYRALVRRRFPADGVRVASGGALVHVRHRGRGPAVVLVHGSNGVSWDFPEALIEDLARDHSVLVLDRPGHGHSSAGGAEPGLASGARAVLDVIGALGGGPAIVVGHSYGAAVALRAALDGPERVRGVLAVSPALVVDGRNARWARAGQRLPALAPLLWLLGLPVGALVAPAVRRAAWSPEPAPPGWSASRAFALCPDQLANAGRNARPLAADLAALAHDLAVLSTPLAVMAGAGDRITPPEQHLAPLRACPGARVADVPGAGHWLVRTHPALVAEAVRRLEGPPQA